MTIVNRTVPMALRDARLLRAEVEQIEAYINDKGTIVGAPGLKDEHLPVFDVAVGERAISHMGHIKMMAAAQPFLSGAISKTVNLPQTATVDDIAEAYTEGWKHGLKALAIYRDGSKTAQALRTDAAGRRRGGRRGQPGAGAPQDAARARVDHPQVLDRRPRGLHHGRQVRGRLGRRDLPHRHRQGGLDAARDDERVRDRDLDRPAVRRAARDLREEVQLHALRPGGDHRQPGDPVRQVDARLHHALARAAGSSTTSTSSRTSASSPRRCGRARRRSRRCSPTTPRPRRNGGNGNGQRQRRRRDHASAGARRSPPPRR